LPKTASTLLQDRLFAEHPDVEFLGTFHHRTKRPFGKCRDAEVQALLDELVFKRAKDPDLELARRLFRAAVAPSLEAGKIPVWSWESLALSGPEIRRARAENLHAVFGDCKVVLILRNPIALIESVYFQHLKRENVGGKYRRFRRPWFHSIDTWLERSWVDEGAPDAHLDYATTVQMFVDVFGRENVAVYLFEDLVADSMSFLERLCAFTGIEFEAACELTQRARSNDRWTQEHLDEIQRIAASPIQRIAFQLADKQARLKMIGLDEPVGTAEGPRARAPLSATWLRRIEARTSVGNRRLVEDWSLPLADYGYPMGG
jgi:hypothetical protein